MQYQLLYIFLIFFSNPIIGQKTAIEDCYEIKYLDFFKFNQKRLNNFSDSEIEEWTKELKAFQKRGDTLSTTWIIPILIGELKLLHPNCNPNIDILYFNKIVAFYCLHRGIESCALSDKSIEQKIDFCRNDFYNQVKNKKLLSQMFFSLSSGPFFGNNFDSMLPLNAIETLNTDFGHLSIAKSRKENIMSAYDSDGSLIWRKSFYEPTEKISKLAFHHSRPIEQNSLAFIINMFTQNDILTLYLKKDGRFLFYYLLN